MKTILLYGFLGKQFGKVHRYDVKNPSEAVKAMCATLEGFRAAIIDGGSYRVNIGGNNDLLIEDTFNPISDKETIRIIPIISGSGGGFGRIIFGAALIFVTSGFSAPLFAGAAAGSALAGVSIASIGLNIGVSMILGGISELLFSPPSPSGSTATREAASNNPSFVFDGAVNTVAQGNPIPVCYGRLIVGSQVISAGLSVEQVTI